MSGEPGPERLSTLPLPAGAPVLAIDGASPVASAAVARDGALLAERAHAEARSSGILLALIEATLRAAGVAPAGLAALVALRGPGSFTGTRVTLATAKGLVLAGVPRATAVSNLEALALAAPSAFARPLAAVDALRGEWFLQPWAAGPDGPQPLAPPELAGGASPHFQEVDGVVGFGRAALAARWPELPVHEPDGLAAAVAVAASRGRWSWNSEELTRPLYLRPPAARATG